MIELRTLGMLDLRGADGREFRPVLQQPKRLALLAYLALDTPRRFHRRDALLALFWPELDSEHARAALRRSLYFLRRSLGERVLIGRGDEEIGLAEEEIDCDATTFERLLGESRLADALELYRGELLRGFYIAGSPEFERWLDGERARLHARAAEASWRLAEELTRRSDAQGAVRWGRRAAALTPYDEPAHRRLLTLLARLGDRASALRAHEEFASRLRADYELEPSPETRGLVAKLRAQSETERAVLPPPSSTAFGGETSRSAPVHAATPLSPTAIAVLPFTVRGSRDFAYLGEGMVDLLSTTLDGAGELRTVDPRALLGFVAREESGELDPTRARHVAQRFGAAHYVLGSIVEAGGRLRVTATLYGTDASPRARAEVQGASEAGIFDMVDDLTRQLLADQSAGPSARQTRLAALTTHSLPALKSYLRGECEFRAGRYFQALEAFQNAAAEDATFALAYYRLASAAAAVADPEQARDAAEQAFRHRGRMAEHDRLLLDAQRAWLRGEADEAERLYTAVVSSHVDDLEAWFLLGDVQFHHNPLYGRSMVEARDAFERALHYDPEHLSSLVHLARIAALERREQELDDLVDRILELSPAGDRALSMRALRAFALGHQIEKARVVTALGRARALAVGIAFTDIALYARDLSGAHHLVRVFAKLTREPEGRALCHIMLAHLEMMRGRIREANGALETVVTLDQSWGLEMRALFALLPFVDAPRAEVEAVRKQVARWDADAASPNRNLVLATHNGMHSLLRHYLLGLLDARLGEARTALAQAGELERAASATPQGAFANDLALSVRAHLAWRNGEMSKALALLESMHGGRWYQLTVTSPFFGQAHDRYLRAELLRQLGRTGEATGWYATLGESSPFELVYLAPAARALGLMAERAGDRDLAVTYFARALEVWGDGGELAPLAREIREKLDALRRRGAGARAPEGQRKATASLSGRGRPRDE